MNSKLFWTQVETGSAITWKYPSTILKGDNSVSEFYSVAVTNNYQQADTGTKMIHIGRNTHSRIISKGISAGHSQNSYRGLVKILPGAENARNYSQCDSLLRHHRARGHHLQDQRGPALLLPPEGHPRGERRRPDHRRLHQGGHQQAPDGVCGRGSEAARGLARGQCRVGHLVFDSTT